MAKRSFKSSQWTPVGVADATNFTSGGYMALQGGSSTQRTNIIEIMMGGATGASAVNPMIFARDSTVGATLSALSTGESDASFDPATAALGAPVQPFTTSTTKPQRSATLGLLTPQFNSFGGVVRWVAREGEEISMLGNTASFGELSLSCYTGGSPGLIGATIIYETL